MSEKPEGQEDDPTLWEAEAGAGEESKPDDGDDAGEEALMRAAERYVIPARERPVAPKEYYSISEVCELVGLRPHVLRYWEAQFPVLNPSKNRSGNRVYQRKEIKLILLVKHLLYEEKYTVEGARARIEQMRRGGELPTVTARALDQEMLALLRMELHELLQLLTPPQPS